MKTSIFSTLLFTFLFALTAVAAPPLLIETTITGMHDKDVLSVPSITVESGREALIQVNGIEYAITATLGERGLVGLRATLAQPDSKKTERLSLPQIDTKLGEAAEFAVGQLSFAITTTLVK